MSFFLNSSQFFHLFSCRCPKINDSFKHTAVISCSSGSSGMPKSVILPHALFAHLFLNVYSALSFVSLNFSSMYWVSGLIAVIGIVFTSKPRIFTAKPFSPEIFYRLVDDYQVRVQYGYYADCIVIVDIRSKHFIYCVVIARVQ